MEQDEGVRVLRIYERWPVTYGVHLDVQLGSVKQVQGDGGEVVLTGCGTGALLAAQG